MVLINIVLGIIFLITGMLNLVLVHPVPGIFYLVLSLIYYPPAYDLLKEKLGLTIPPWVKIVLGLVILWGTLAVGDLAEVIGM